MTKVLTFFALMLPAFLQLLTACATTTESGETGVGRRQLLLVPSRQIEAASAQAYEEVKRQAQAKGVLDKNANQLRRLAMISQRLIPQAAVFRKEASNWGWEIHLITQDELNAYCMPGGKIMFYTALIEKLNLSDAEIAAVMGHEIAHALREHGRERMSEEVLKMMALEIGVETGVINQKYAGALMALSQVLISLPHGRGQETEADIIGLELMARAGYNPEEALSLWRKMAGASGGKPPEFLSTHPADETRINSINSYLPKVMPLYLRAKTKGT